MITRAITLIQPMGWAIVHKHKPYENRGRHMMPLDMRSTRTTIAIHNGATWDDDYARFISAAVATPPPWSVSKTVAGIIGVATFTGRVFTLLDPPPEGPGRAWFFGPFAYEIDTAESIAFADVIPCRGFHGFWNLTAGQRLAIAERIRKGAA